MSSYTIHRAISTYIVKKAGLKKKTGAKTGAVTFIQRFGGSLNLNIHFHIMYLDGAYTFSEGRAEFHNIPTPRPTEVNQLLITISKRVVKLLEKRGLIFKDETNQLFLSTDQAPRVMDQVQGSSITYRIALGSQKGRKTLTLRSLPQTVHEGSQLLDRHSGFSLHAGLSCRGHERQKLERICRYISRPSLSEERLSVNGKGQVVYKLKKSL